MDHNAMDALVFAARCEGAHPLVLAAALAMLRQEAEHHGALSRMAERIAELYLQEVWLGVNDQGEHYLTVALRGAILTPMAWGLAVDRTRQANDSERLRLAQVLVGL